MRTIIVAIVSVFLFVSTLEAETVDFRADKLPPGAGSTDHKPICGNVPYFYADCFFFICKDGVALNYLVRPITPRPHGNKLTSFRQTFSSKAGTIKRHKGSLVFVDLLGANHPIAKQTGKWFGDYWEPLKGVSLTLVAGENPYAPTLQLTYP